LEKQFFGYEHPHKLNEIDREKCEGLLTEKECLEAVKSMESSKSPGTEVLFGITRPCTDHLTLNHHIMLGKYFLYVNALNNTIFVFSNFISLVQDKNIIEIEKYIAAMLNGEREFQQKWKFLLTI